MAGASDKARFYLEQSVPELKEYEKKKIFSGEEITSIARKRSDFEHKINARGSTAVDYVRYAEFEMNVETLRKKRVKRLGIKATNHNGQRRIFFVFDRGTRKHPGDFDLWMQLIEYARKQKAHKKLSQIFANVLRLHPTKADLWIYAAQFSVDEHGDMTEARGYLQRGLRFCKNVGKLWLEYTRLEMSYIAKIHARREILGINGNAESATKNVLEGDKAVEPIPQLMIDDHEEQQEEEDEPKSEAQINFYATPAMSGAIPIAIFDAAMSNFNQDISLACEFFDMIYDYEAVPATRQILSHIDALLQGLNTSSWDVCSCHCRMAIVGIPITSPEFPPALREALKRLLEGREKVDAPVQLVQWSRSWLESLREDSDLDPALHKAISLVLGSLEYDSNS